MQLSKQQIEEFQQNGYLIQRQLIDMTLLNDIRKQVKNHLQMRLPPFELEADLGYPKAPKSVSDTGGKTIRRLLLAYTRDIAFRQWSKNKVVKNILQQLFDSQEIWFVQSHHNCIMTKQPDYSSQTGWHRDIRYWRFENDFLINTWLAMGVENNANGCLKILPGTHHLPFDDEMVDDELFLNVDNPKAKQWLENSTDVELNAGDVLFFHAGIFHAANNNVTDQAKYSLVYSYHDNKNSPIPDSKSTTYEEVSI